MKVQAADGRSSWCPALTGMLVLRLAAGLALVFLLEPVSVDDAFRTFHAMWWWKNPSFYPLPHWPPGTFWVYGLVNGLLNDGLVVPRLLTLALSLATIIWILSDVEETPGVRWSAAIWFAFSPLGLVLGTVPLSEALFLFLLTGGMVLLRRYLRAGSPWCLLGASTMYLLCTTVRYEGWAFVPMFLLLSLLRRSSGSSSFSTWALRLLPCVFPVIWVLLLWKVEARPLLFLGNVATDSFGRGSLAETFSSPSSWIVLLQLVMASVVMIWSGWRVVRQGRSLSSSIWEAHGAMAMLVLILALVSGNLPSQYTIRVFHPLIVFSCIPMGHWLSTGHVSRVRLRRRSFALGIVLIVGSILYIDNLEAGHDQEAQRVAGHVEDARLRGALDEKDHILVDMLPPRTMSVVVYLNRWDVTHVDSTHHQSYFSCWRTPAPVWMKDVRAAVVRKERSVNSLRDRGWEVLVREGGWQLLIRTPDASSPTSCPGGGP